MSFHTFSNICLYSILYPTFEKWWSLVGKPFWQISLDEKERFMRHSFLKSIRYPGFIGISLNSFIRLFDLLQINPWTLIDVKLEPSYMDAIIFHLERGMNICYIKKTIPLRRKVIRRHFWKRSTHCYSMRIHTFR